MEEKGYSRKCFMGQIIHYDTDGNKVGESVRNLCGCFDHYDANDEKVARRTSEVDSIITIMTTKSRVPACAASGARKTTITIREKRSVKVFAISGADEITMKRMNDVA